jgi:hypothetical protein
VRSSVFFDELSSWDHLLNLTRPAISECGRHERRWQRRLELLQIVGRMRHPRILARLRTSSLRPFRNCRRSARRRLPRRNRAFLQRCQSPKTLFRNSQRPRTGSAFTSNSVDAPRHKGKSRYLLKLRTCHVGPTDRFSCPSFGHEGSSPIGDGSRRVFDNSGAVTAQHRVILWE